MAELMRFEHPEQTSRRPPSRSRILSARFTEEEYVLLENCAGSKGKTLSDWTHDTLLQFVRDGGGGRMEMFIFTEIIGLELLLNNALKPLVMGQTLTAEWFQHLLDAVRSNKAPAAEEILARRRAEAGI
jgi:hypothetical protein